MAFTPLTDVFGETPQVASFIPTDYAAEQQKAIQENIAAFPELSQLGDLYQNYMISGLQDLIPGIKDIFQEGGATTQAMFSAATPLLEGQIPQDVQDQVYRSTAFQSLMSGEAGSPMSRGLTARDLGLTSLNLIQQGAGLAGQAGNAAQRWQSMAMQTMLPPNAMMITPQQQAQLTWANNLMKQLTQQAKYNVAAAPSPVAAGISGTIMNLLGAYLGAMGGGKMGGAGGSTFQSAPYASAGYDPQGIPYAVPVTGQTGGVVGEGSMTPVQHFQMGGTGGKGDITPPAFAQNFGPIMGSFESALSQGIGAFGGGGGMDPGAMAMMMPWMGIGGGGGFQFPSSMFSGGTQATPDLSSILAGLASGTPPSDVPTGAVTPGFSFPQQTPGVDVSSPIAAPYFGLGSYDPDMYSLGFDPYGSGGLSLSAPKGG